MRKSFFSIMRQKVFESVGIIIFSVFLAFITNYFRSDGLPLLRTNRPPASLSSENERKAGIISLQILLKKLKQTGVIILDARSPDEFGEGHIPGAKNLPYSEVPEESTFDLSEVPFDMEIITYCEGAQCSLAEDLAVFLQEMGYENVKVFAGGWEKWTESKMPVEQKQNF